MLVRESPGASHRDEIRWPLGEAVMRDNRFVPGAFVFAYAAVIGCKWLARTVRRGLTPKPPQVS